MCLGALLICGLNVAWYARFRWGFVTDYDESGYMVNAFADLDALNAGGTHALYQVAIHSFGSQPPLVPVSTIPLLLVLGRHLDVAPLIELPYLFLLLLATYGIARRMMSSAWAGLAAITLGAVPAVSDYSRLFHFSVPAAALMTAGLWALLRSDALRRRGWAIGGGVLLGLMLLARTMTVSYVPGIALGLALQVAAAEQARPRRIINFVVVFAIAALVASVWWVPDFGAVTSYLTSTGYGSSASNYGVKHALFSWGWWTKELYVAANDLYLPLSLTLLVCFAIAATVSVRGLIASPRWQPRIRELISADAFLLACVVAEGYLALTSTANNGTAFSLPWFPSLVILGMAAAARVPIRRVRIGLAVVVTAVTGFNLAMKNGIATSLGQPLEVNVGLTGPVTIIDGRDVLYRALAVQYPDVPVPPRRLPVQFRRWLPFEKRLAAFMIGYAEGHHQQPFFVPLAGDYLLSDGRVLLESELAFHRIFATLGELAGPDTRASYLRQLSSDGANFILTAAPARSQISPVTRQFVEQAASQLGFRRVLTTTAPDRRDVALWWRNPLQPPPPPAVERVSPAPGTSETATKAIIVVTFSQPMDEPSTQSAFRLETGTRTAVAGSFSWFGPTTLIFRPGSRLLRHAQYVAVLSTVARAQGTNVRLAKPISWTFSTAPAALGH